MKSIKMQPLNFKIEHDSHPSCNSHSMFIPATSEMCKSVNANLLRNDVKEPHYKMSGLALMPRQKKFTLKANHPPPQPLCQG